MSKKSKTIEKITTANVELKKTLAGVRGQLTKTQSQLDQGDREGRPLEEGSSRAPHGRGTLRRPGGEAPEQLDRATAALKPAPATKERTRPQPPETPPPNPAPRTGSRLLTRPGPWSNSGPRPTPED